jgi:ATP-binding cassette, subfamily B, multidrug efflux pump
MRDSSKTEKATRELFRYLWKYLKPYRRMVYWGLICLFLASSLNMVTPWMVKVIIDGLTTGVPFSKTLQSAVIIMVVTLFQCWFRYLMRRNLISASRYAEYDQVNDVFNHVQQLPQTFFHKFRTGDIMSRVANDVGTMRMVIGPGILQIGNTAVSLVFALFMMVAIDPLLTLIALLPLPFMPIALYTLGNQIRIRSEKVQEQLAAINTKAQENLTGIRIVKAYNMQQTEQRDFERLSQEFIGRNLKLTVSQGMFMPLLILLAGISVIVILGFGGWRVIQNRITLGSLVAFMDYLTILTWPMFAVGWVIGLVQQGAAAMHRIKVLYDEPAVLEMLPESSRYDQRDLQGNIEFHNVAFRHDPSRDWVLRDLNFCIHRGETVAIMGRSGSGKTTLLNLLTKTYMPETGAIRLNAIPMTAIPAFDIREQLGVMPQDIMLFSDTILSNLEFGARIDSRPDYSRICALAAVHDEIMEIPENYQARLGERGINLSGGQKQRLTLARALVRNASFLILDDPFSSVDIATEEFILQSLQAIKDGRTVIIVSHRINTARRADRIFIIEDGNVVESGTHEQLIGNKKYYYHLYRKQQIREELEAI